MTDKGAHLLDRTKKMRGEEEERMQKQQTARTNNSGNN